MPRKPIIGKSGWHNLYPSSVHTVSNLNTQFSSETKNAYRKVFVSNLRLASNLLKDHGITGTIEAINKRISVEGSKKFRICW